MTRYPADGPSTRTSIAMLTPYWYPVRGGITSYVSGLCEELTQSFSADVRIIAREGEREGAIILGGSPTEFVTRALAELERFAPQVVHVHGHWYALRAGLVYRRRHPGTRVVCTLHTEFVDRGVFRRLILRRLLSRADVVTAVSEDLLRRTLAAFHPRTRTRVTRPGTSIQPASPSDVEQFIIRALLPRRKPRIAFVGPLVYAQKSRGVGQLIQAMHAIRRKHPNAVLVVAGDGVYRESLENLASQEIPGGVVFLGTTEDPAPLYGAADVVAHVSFQEGLPLAVLEAMRCGAPIVASRTGGIPEVVRDGENGLLTTDGVDSIASQILSLLDSEELRSRLATQAKADAIHRFSWESAARRFVQLYGVPAPHEVAVTIDLERDYAVPRAEYRGIEEALPRLLGLLDQHRIQATFFATSDLCDPFADRLRDVVRRGHAVGCHGETHDVEYLALKSHPWQMDSIRRATESLAAVTGVRPIGFRAPNFSANGATIRVLDQLGYRYDSSVLPGRVVRARRVRKLLNFLGAPSDPYNPSFEDSATPGGSRILEIPVTENPQAPGGPIGLGWVNVRGVDAALDAISRSCSDVCVLVIHPWEMVDPPPGRIPGWMRISCSSDVSKVGAFFARLQSGHRLTTMEDVLHDRGRLKSEEIME